MTRLHIIPQAALDQHIAILGKTGSGKSYAAKGIVERLLDAKRQVCVLDPTAAWWGLRLGADGKSRGYDVVLLGGAHADIPLSERSGQAVARLVTQQLANVVIDTSGMTVGEYTRWFIDFAGTLYTTIRSPLHLVIDEAHHFMPQGKTPDPQAGKMLHAGNRLMSGGRSLGIRGLMITQRPAKLHKDSLTCADTLIAMRVLAPQDRSAIEDWIDGAGDPKLGKEVLDSLAQLKRGEGWVWYPEGGHLKRTAFPRIKTYDSSSTPTHGVKAGPAVREIDLGEVRAAMAEAVREAEANDPRLLRAEIAKLKAAAGKSAPSVVDDKAVERAVAARDREWESKLRDIERQSQGYVGRLRKIGELAALNGEAKIVQLERPGPVVPPGRLTVRPAERSSGQAPAAMSRKGGKYRMLVALAQQGRSLSYATLGAMAGLSSQTGTFGTYLAEMRSAGHVEGRGEVAITDAGREALGDYDPLPVGADLRAYWLRKCGNGGKGRIFQVVCEAYPNAVRYDELGQLAKLSPTTGTFGTYLAELRTLQLIEGRGEVKAVDALFEDA
jgi:hypothetical protein